MIMEFLQDYIRAVNVSSRFLCFFCASIFFFLSGSAKKYNRVYLYFQLFFFCIGCWNLAYVGYMITEEPRIAAFCNSLIFVFNSFTGFFYLIFCLCFTFPSLRIRFLSLFAVIPVLTSLFSLAYPFFDLMFQYEYVFVSRFPPRIPEYYGPWYYVHLTYSYLISFAGIICLFLKLFKKATANRKTVAMMIVGSLFLIIWNFVYTLFASSDGLVVFWGGISHLFCIFTFFFAVHFDNIEQMVSLAAKYKDDLFPVPILIVDKRGYVVYFNSKAENILKEKKISPYTGFTLESLAPLYTKRELPFNFPLSEFHRSCLNLFLIEDKNTKTIFYVEAQELKNSRNSVLGVVYSLIDISQINRLLSALENFAFRDMLTGTYNRHFLEMKKGILTETGTEITLLMCDIDDLKKVNDIHGHSVGDAYIKMCSEILFDSVRKRDLIFRIGGDEFLVILFDTDESGVADRITRIRENLSPSLYNDFEGGMSVGAAGGFVGSIEDFNRLMEKADRAMYQVKMQRKNLSPADSPVPPVPDICEVIDF